MRYKLTIEYCGTPFVGWQRQSVGLSVQGVIEKALRQCGACIKPNIVGAGRTDSGVHAAGQVAHIDLDKPWAADKLKAALNHFLQAYPVVILAAQEAHPNFHARFDATERTYLYRILNRPCPPTWQQNTIWHVKHPLDINAMQQGANYLIGTHDFTTFRASLCQAKSPIKRIDHFHIWQDGQQILFEIKARSFLHNQIRSFVGSLAKVGQHKWPSDQIKTALEAKNRRYCGPVAPPDGLYLTHVQYPQMPEKQRTNQADA